MNCIYVAGVGMTPFGRHFDKSLNQLALHAGQSALIDAGLSGKEVGIGYFANALAGRLFGDSTLGQSVFAALGINKIPILNVENACTSGSSAFYLACQSVRCGEVDIALVIGAEKMCVPQIGLMNSGDSDCDALLGLVPPASFAMRAQRHMHEYGTTLEQLAMVSVKNRRHAKHNPVAQYREEINIKQVLSSPMISNPLTRLQSSPIADGAAAVVICNEQVAKRIGATVRIRAAVLCSGDYLNPQSFSRWQTDYRGALEVYEKAGVGPDELDLVECHDAFSISELMHYEALGLCDIGKGGEFIESGATTLGGAIPVNASGGLLSKGHPIAATGVAQIVELQRQLTKCADKRQVMGARVGLAHCMGGDLSADTKSYSLAILSL